jgi:hypothetical protein
MKERCFIVKIKQETIIERGSVYEAALNSSEGRGAISIMTGSKPVARLGADHNLGVKRMETITRFDDKCIIVNIPIGIDQRGGLYEATRRCWRVSLRRARRADYVLGTVDGKVLCVIKPNRCDYVSADFCAKEKKRCKEVFHTDTALCEHRKRIAFEGAELKDDTKYLGKMLPAEYIPGQCPVRYTYT